MLQLSSGYEEGGPCKAYTSRCEEIAGRMLVQRLPGGGEIDRLPELQLRLDMTQIIISNSYGRF